MVDITCSDNVILDFSATYVVPATFDLEDATKFSIAVSTDGLNVYKDIIDYQAPSIIGPCGETVTDVNVKLAQVKVSGVIVYRAAAHGIQTDPLVIPAELQDRVNVNGDIWTSADGFVEVTDGENDYITLGFVLPDEDVNPDLLNVTLRALEVGSTYIEERSNNRVITLEGQFELSYRSS